MSARNANLGGKVVMITGATTGIGRQCALTLAASGASIVVTGRKEHLGTAVVQEITTAGGAAAFVSLDVTQENAWNAAIAATRARFGRLDGLINNAGEDVAKPIGELTLDDLLYLLHVNVEHCFLGIKAALPLMERGGGGLIINVGSVAALRPMARNTIYGASKAAIGGMALAAGRELAAAGSPVRVIALHPGLIWSSSVEDHHGKEGAKRFHDYIVAKTPAARVGKPSDVADVVAFLMSDAARGVNAQEIVVDGGLNLSFP